MFKVLDKLKIQYFLSSHNRALKPVLPVAFDLLSSSSTGFVESTQPSKMLGASVQPRTFF